MSLPSVFDKNLTFQDQKRLRGFLRLADLGHLAVEGEPLVGKKFSRLISGVVSKLETRYIYFNLVSDMR